MDYKLNGIGKAWCKIMNNRQKVYRQFLYGLLLSALVVLFTVWLMSIWEQVPSTITIRTGIEEQFDFGIPATANIYKETMGSVAVKGDSEENIQEVITLDMTKPVTFYANEIDNYSLVVKLFGVIPFKSSQVNVIQDIKLIPAGLPIGIYVETDGILVIATGSFLSNIGDLVSPTEHILQEGDYILKVDGEDVTTKAAFIEKIADSNGTALTLTIRRSGEVFDLKVIPVQDESREYKLGIWIRDNAQGVGTLTYISENGEFGALGHGINDVDTSTLMYLESGELYKTEIVSITKGVDGIPGELTGVISYAEQNKIGTILANTNSGIFGYFDDVSVVANQATEESQATAENQAVDIGLKQEITLGEAQICCTLTGEIKWYDVMITAVHLENDNVNRGIELEVVDEELLEITGGIVQGMSGAPILQNGKLIGAVTHVFVNDPTRGYGIFIENMLETAESVK